MSHELQLTVFVDDKELEYLKSMAAHGDRNWSIDMAAAVVFNVGLHDRLLEEERNGTEADHVHV